MEESIKHLEELARIRIPESEQARFAGDISSILEYINQIQGADLPKASAGDVRPVAPNQLREDMLPPRPDQYRDDLLEEAPRLTKDHITVPRVLK